MIAVNFGHSRNVRSQPEPLHTLCLKYPNQERVPELAPAVLIMLGLAHFQAEEVQILELTQSTIIEPLQELISNEEWGDPTGYSLSVTRKGMSFSDTEYSVVPSPAQPTPANVLKAYKEKPINLDALYSGDNPFEAADGVMSAE